MSSLSDPVSGGSVTALRLTEKGYRVGVLEAGRRFADDEFAKTSWRICKFLWAPRLGLYGIQRIHLLPDAVILAGAGVGGGSLVYANTRYAPPAECFQDPQWASITDWLRELVRYYGRARRMLGVTDIPTWIPAGNEAARRIAERIDGFPVGQLGNLIDAPMTAHFVGGCCIGADAGHGVIDAYHRVFGYDGLHIVDGSAVSANPGVNPALTIIAQAERAMALWPNKGRPDLRPPSGSAYVEVPVVVPVRPVVPSGAPGALRLPIVAVRPGAADRRST